MTRMTNNTYPASGNLYEASIPNGIQIEIYVPDDATPEDISGAILRAHDRLVGVER